MMRKWFASKKATWSLNNPLKGWTLHGLTLSEARLLLHTLSMAERRVVWAWKTGTSEWVRLDDPACAELNERFVFHDQGAPPLPVAGDNDEITAVRLSGASAPKSFQQRPARKQASIPAEIIQGQQTFRTRTENVASGGIKFTDVLPEWVAGYFTVILGLETGPIEVTCMLVEDQKNSKTRVEVVETEDEESHLPAYREWVKNH